MHGTMFHAEVEPMLSITKKPKCKVTGKYRRAAFTDAYFVRCRIAGLNNLAAADAQYSDSYS